MLDIENEIGYFIESLCEAKLKEKLYLIGNPDIKCEK